MSPTPVPASAARADEHQPERQPFRPMGEPDNHETDREEHHRKSRHASVGVPSVADAAGDRRQQSVDDDHRAHEKTRRALIVAREER
jgi:hypothetical protein